MQHKKIIAGITLALLLCGLGLTFLPLDRHVSVPAVSLPEKEAWVFAPEPARVSGGRPAGCD